ncbi:LLM class flavin-dependent oxidoreductase [Nocardioides mangrovicus]|uniref:LLM class flavin-dependent oxidoreductase n=1 Tax=Nocardioides mangrovicus TaxID=2478913 RepID=A0A3L8P073_9ACTN|nr:LLM class flavin-dependent oxidoreductase [Nocardioides mangrovicus]RLV47768.1 LLM class flavin-dependent oxidoreductase [Nocardioides mangrovicus]
MTDQPSRPRPIRFGVVTPVAPEVGAWRDEVRRIADWGYEVVLVPDVPGWQPAPAVTLAAAAMLADVRVGTWVYAAPVRPAFVTAWEAHSLTQLTEGRFELGLGTGRPGIGEHLVELGIPDVAPADRVTRIREVVEALRDLDGDDLRTPVAMAVSGPRSTALAAEIADTVNFAIAPGEGPEALERRVREFTSERDPELALHISIVGDTVAPFMAGPGTDPVALREQRSYLVLPADPAAAAEEILRRRETLGFSYIVCGSNSAATLAPVVAELAGR